MCLPAPGGTIVLAKPLGLGPREAPIQEQPPEMPQGQITGRQETHRFKNTVISNIQSRLSLYCTSLTPAPKEKFKEAELCKIAMVSVLVH